MADVYQVPNPCKRVWVGLHDEKQGAHEIERW
jgi:hypothetical protein